MIGVSARSVDARNMQEMCSSRLICRMFVGQSKGSKNNGSRGSGTGITQKEQQKVLADFRSGAFNTLVATCIGEEGLDICQVQSGSFHSCDAAQWSSAGLHQMHVLLPPSLMAASNAFGEASRYEG